MRQTLLPIASDANSLTVAMADPSNIAVVDEEALTQLLDKAHGENPETLVLVQADKAVAHGKVVAVMDLARRHGLARLAIATRDDGR